MFLETWFQNEFEAMRYCVTVDLVWFWYCMGTATRNREPSPCPAGVVCRLLLAACCYWVVPEDICILLAWIFYFMVTAGSCP